jgi:hypothetical protein
MANQILNVLTDRFNSLAVLPNAWLLFLPSVAYLDKGDVLTIREVDPDGVYLGRSRDGVCKLTQTANFFYFDSTVKEYLLQPLSSVYS